MTHDYKEAYDVLDRISERNGVGILTINGKVDERVYYAMCHALEMMQKLDEPSYSMIGSYILVQGEGVKVSYSGITMGIKAMIEQAQREIEHG